MRRMIERAVRKPSRSDLRFGDRRNALIGRWKSVAFTAGFHPKKPFRLIHLRRDPRCLISRLRPRKARNARCRRRGPQFLRVSGNPYGEFLRQEVMDHRRIFVWCGIAESGIKRERMALRAMLVIIDRLHETLVRRGLVLRQRRGGIRSTPWPRLPIPSPVAIGTDKSHVAFYTPQTFLQMNRMIEAYGARIFRDA